MLHFIPFHCFLFFCGCTREGNVSLEVRHLNFYFKPYIKPNPLLDLCITNNLTCLYYFQHTPLNHYFSTDQFVTCFNMATRFSQSTRNYWSIAKAFSTRLILLPIYLEFFRSSCQLSREGKICNFKREFDGRRVRYFLSSYYYL